MDGLEIALAGILLAVAALNALASRVGIPYPIVLVLGGLALGLVPAVPEVVLDPDLVLLVFLPPLLYSAAFFADLRSLRRYARALSLSAIGLVLVTIGAVAAAGHLVLGLPWPVAFVLGAIVSPTDPVAATAIMRRLGAPRTIVDLVEGESLVNDAAALVAYRVALAAVLEGTFSAGAASVELVVSVVGGVAIGAAVGWVVAWARRHIEDPLTEITVTLVTGYLAFLPAEELHLSGVLSVVTAGLYLGWRSPELTDPATRLEGFAVWEVLTFVLNATLFVLIGLQLPVVLDGLTDRTAPELIGDAALVIVVVVGTRFAWLFSVPYVVRAVDRRPRQRDLRVGAGARAVVAWSGLRGAVSLATALAVPLVLDDGAPFPDRDLVVFLTFSVVLVTVVGQGLTLPTLIRRLGVVDDGTEEEQEVLHARLRAAARVLAELEVIDGEGWAGEDDVEAVRARYVQRERRFAARAGAIADDGYEDASQVRQRLVRRVLAEERRAVVEMRNAGEISNDVMHRLERELDLYETHLDD